MTTFKVSVPEDKTSLFFEVMDLLGVLYEPEETDFTLSQEQKQFLSSQDNIEPGACSSAFGIVEELKKKYGL